MNDCDGANRERLIKLLSNSPVSEAAQGWKNTGKFAVGGLREIGFQSDPSCFSLSPSEDGASSTAI